MLRLQRRRLGVRRILAGHAPGLTHADPRTPAKCLLAWGTRSGAP